MSARRNGKPLALTELEMITLQGIQARETLFRQQIEQEFALALREIERRLRLPKGSIPDKWVVNLDSATVTLRADGN